MTSKRTGGNTYAFNKKLQLSLNYCLKVHKKQKKNETIKLKTTKKIKKMVLNCKIFTRWLNESHTITGVQLILKKSLQGTYYFKRLTKIDRHTDLLCRWQHQFEVSNSERQIFEKFFHGNSYLFSGFFARNLLRGKRRRNIFSHFIFDRDGLSNVAYS